MSFSSTELEAPSPSKQRPASEGGPYTLRQSVAGRADVSEAAFLLGLGQRGRDFFENGKMLVNVGLGVLHGNGPLLVPPIRLGEDAAIDHTEPVVAPEIDINLGPVTVVTGFLWIEDQHAA